MKRRGYDRGVVPPPTTHLPTYPPFQLPPISMAETTIRFPPRPDEKKIRKNFRFLRKDPPPYFSQESFEKKNPEKIAVHNKRATTVNDCSYV